MLTFKTRHWNDAQRLQSWFFCQCVRLIWYIMNFLPRSLISPIISCWDLRILGLLTKVLAIVLAKKFIKKSICWQRILFVILGNAFHPGYSNYMILIFLIFEQNTVLERKHISQIFAIKPLKVFYELPVCFCSSKLSQLLNSRKLNCWFNVLFRNQ